MEIVHDQTAHTITLSQQCYVETILDHHGMSSCWPITTPIVVGLKLAKLEEPEVDVWEYQSRLGALMYAMLGTHPELAFAITILSQHSATPGKAHLAVLNHVFSLSPESSQHGTNFWRQLHSSDSHWICWCRLGKQHKWPSFCWGVYIPPC
jgi:hypothetical protein